MPETNYSTDPVSSWYWPVLSLFALLSIVVAAWLWLSAFASSYELNLSDAAAAILVRTGVSDVATPEFQSVVGGEFIMGSEDGIYYASADEQPMHRVKVKAFDLARYETTVNEYYGYAASTGRKIPLDDSWRQDRRPMVYVSWNEARHYSNWLSAVLAKRCSLPTEAQWEYAARANTSSAWQWADNEAQAEAHAGEFAWFMHNSGGMRQTVGTRLPNAFGVYDMSGNVWEWVEDCWHENYRNAPVDGGAWLERDGGNCSARVLRGGAWYDFPGSLRSALRDSAGPDGRENGIGFRVACR